MLVIKDFRSISESKSENDDHVGTRESETQMRIEYPELFQDGIEQSVHKLNSGSTYLLVGENCNNPNSGPINLAQQGPNPLQEILGNCFKYQSLAI